MHMLCSSHKIKCQSSVGIEPTMYRFSIRVLSLSASVKLQRSDRYLQEPQQLHISRQEHFNFTKRYLHSSSGYNRLTRNISLYPYANPAYIPVPNSRDLAHSICTKTCSYNGHTDSLCTVKRDVELELGLSVKTLKAFVELALFYYGLKEIRPLRFATSNRCSIKLKRIFFWQVQWLDGTWILLQITML